MAETSPVRSTPPPQATTLIACVAVLCVIWGSTWWVIAEGLRDITPLTAGAARFVLASLVMMVLAPTLARREGGARPNVRLVLSMGLLNFAVSYGIVYWVETRLASGLVSVLWATFPIMMAIAAHTSLAGERLQARQWAGFLAGFLGVLLLFATDVRNSGEGGAWVGALLLLSPLASTVGTTYVKAKGGAHSSVLLNRDGMVVGGVTLCALAFMLEEPMSVVWTPRAIVTVVYLAVFGTALSFGLYFWVMRYVPAYRLSLISYVTPVLALFLGSTFGGERVGLETLVGLGLILVGVGGVLSKRHPKEGQLADLAVESHADVPSSAR